MFLESRAKVVSVLATFALAIFSLHTVAVSLPSFPALAAFAECADGIDNDNDGDVDYPEDANCTSLTDDAEGTSGGIFVSLSDNRDEVSPGGNLTYTISVHTQRNDQQVTDVRFLLPYQTNLLGERPTGNRDGRFITWKNVALDPGNVKKFYVDIQVDPAAREGDVIAAEVVAAGEYGRDSTKVRGRSQYRASNLQISITDGKQFAERDELLTYRILVKNRDAMDREVDVRAGIPQQLIFVAGSGYYDQKNRYVEWNDVTLRAHEEREFLFTGRVERDTRKNVVLYVKASAENAIDTDVTSIGVGLPPQAIDISISDGKKSARPGEVVEHEIIVRNLSTTPAVHIDVNAALPLYTEFVDADEGGYWAGNNIGWNDLTIIPGGERRLHMKIRIEDDAPYGALVRTSAFVNGETAVDLTEIGRTSVTQNSSNSSRPIVRRPSSNSSQSWSDPYYADSGYNSPVYTSGQKALITKTANKSEAKPGDTVIFTLKFQNTTGHTLRNVEIVDKLSEDTASVTSAPGGDIGDGKITWMIAELQPGEGWTRKYSVVISPNAQHGTVIDNIVTVAGQGLEGVALTTRTAIARIGIVETLPATGVPSDTVYFGFSIVMAMAPVLARRRK